MSRLFQELDYRHTPFGPLSLRRRLEPKTGKDIFEIKLGEEFLMSSLFTASEKALANLTIKHLIKIGPVEKKFNVIVGGLGLGYTARSVLQHENVATVCVVDALQAVIDWHQSCLLPLGSKLNSDPRCTMLHGDFFALATSRQGFGKKVDAILVDIDHSPDFHLDDANTAFYQPAGLAKMACHLRPGGIFGLWSDDLPDDNFTARLADIFDQAWVEPVTFFNPLQEKNFTQSVYLATTKCQ